MRTQPEVQVYTIVEFGKIFGIGRNQAYAYVRNGLVPKIVIGKRAFVPKRWVDDQMKAGATAA